MPRPRKNNARCTSVRVRCTKEELKRLKEAAAYRGETVSDYIREAIRNEEDSDSIMDQLINHGNEIY